MTYLEYRNLLNQLIIDNKTTGSDQSESLVDYAKLNNQRMNRLDRTANLLESWHYLFEKLNTNYTWVVLTEGWCGDASQILPVLNHIAASSNGKISLQILLRDENLVLMDNYLTNGGRAIPIVICYDEKNNELWTWGPRPNGAKELINQLKANGAEMEQLKLELHAWYANNKTQEIQLEIFKKLAVSKNTN